MHAAARNGRAVRASAFKCCHIYNKKEKKGLCKEELLLIVCIARATTYDAAEEP